MLVIRVEGIRFGRFEFSFFVIFSYLRLRVELFVDFGEYRFFRRDIRGEKGCLFGIIWYEYIRTFLVAWLGKRKYDNENFYGYF